MFEYHARFGFFCHKPVKSSLIVKGGTLNAQIKTANEILNKKDIAQTKKELEECTGLKAMPFPAVKTMMNALIENIKDYNEKPLKTVEKMLEDITPEDATKAFIGAFANMSSCVLDAVESYITIEPAAFFLLYNLEDVGFFCMGPAAWASTTCMLACRSIITCSS